MGAGKTFRHLLVRVPIRIIRADGKHSVGRIAQRRDFVVGLVARLALGEIQQRRGEER